MNNYFLVQTYGRSKKLVSKSAIAARSYRFPSSVRKARVDFQAVCDKAYGQKYYLTAQEQEKFEPEDVVINDSNIIVVAWK